MLGKLASPFFICIRLPNFPFNLKTHTRSTLEGRPIASFSGSELKSNFVVEQKELGEYPYVDKYCAKFVKISTVKT